MFYEHSFETHASFVGKDKPRGYHVGRNLDDYVRPLGTFKGRDVKETLDNLIQERGRISILDVGCGKGNALHLPLRYLRKVEGFGITASEYRSSLRKALDNLFGINIVQGDVHTLEGYFQQSQFDLVMSYFAMEYMDNSKVLPKIVEVMSPGGIAFLHRGSFEVARTIPEVEELEDTCIGITFRKKSI